VREPGSLAWTELLTRDLPKAKQFYNAVFGWDTATMSAGEGGPDYTLWKFGDQDVGGAMDMPPAVPSQVPAYWQVYFSVDNVDRSAEQIAKLGGKILVEPMDFPGGRLVVAQDPQGATFGIMHSTQ
jgi:hypothetical protein